MGEAIDDALLEVVTKYFTSSSDFNGILVDRLTSILRTTTAEVTNGLERLLKQGKVSVSFASHQSNPYIKRLADLPVHEQLRRIHSESPSTYCVYPAEAILKNRTDIETFSNRPFTRRLALGEPQLIPVFFELAVLERYYRDPRFHFEFHDYSGQIVISDAAYKAPDLPERDKVLLNTFGIGYDKHRNRVVVVYLRYLSDLSPEHQQFWLSHIISDECSMNSDYARATINGEWPEYHSAYRALITEIIELNKLALLIGKAVLFHDTFENSRPAGFLPMLRPTMHNFHDFVHLLDKMVSENINRDFFRGEISLEQEIPRRDGKVQVQPLGTLTLLRDWLRAHYRTEDGEDVSDGIVAPLKHVRDLRQRPAHVIEQDQYDLALPEQQDI